MFNVKICGITNTRDALCACESGAWAIGFIFVQDSPRFVTVARAAEISQKLPSHIEKIGVFVNSPADFIKDAVESVGLTKVQLHGDEPQEFCRSLGVLSENLIKAFRVQSEDDIDKIAAYKEVVGYILMDTYSSCEYGGTGRVFDWNLALDAKKFNMPIILAGGLTPDNASSAFEAVHPYAIDISSGVELSKGIKDHKKIKQLFLSLKG